jgi:hypothetical protein
MMKRLTSFVIGILLFYLLSDVVPLSAQESARYCNARYGFCVSYPIDFGMDPSPTNGDGRRFYDRNGLVISVYGTNNALGPTLQTEMQDQSKDFDRITYQTQGENWFVLSGYKNANILYRKTFVGNDFINYLYVEYPTHLKAEYDAIVAEVEHSFTPGSLNGEN